MTKENRMIATTIEQSKHLLDLGLNPEFADMFYMMYKDGTKPCNGDENLKHIYQDEQGNWYSLDLYEDYFEEDCFKKNGVYALSLSALLELIPNASVYKKEKDNWGCSSVDGSLNEEGDYAMWKDIDGYKTPLEAAYNMVVWLLENGYIKTKIA